ncbi:MAG: WYL domain-containing protein [Thermodesulfobacteriota bacterium]
MLKEELPNGSAVVSFAVRGLTEMVGWLFQWGDMVGILEPAWLREEECSRCARLRRGRERLPKEGVNDRYQRLFASSCEGSQKNFTPTYICRTSPLRSMKGILEDKQ